MIAGGALEREDRTRPEPVGLAARGRGDRTGTAFVVAVREDRVGGRIGRTSRLGSWRDWGRWWEEPPNAPAGVMPAGAVGTPGLVGFNAAGAQQTTGR